MCSRKFCVSLQEGKCFQLFKGSTSHKLDVMLCNRIYLLQKRSDSQDGNFYVDVQ